MEIQAKSWSGRRTTARSSSSTPRFGDLRARQEKIPANQTPSAPRFHHLNMLSGQIALLQGHGSVTFSGCQFVQWDLQKRDGRAAIRALSGSLILTGNSFMANAWGPEPGTNHQLEVGANASQVIVMGNLMAQPKNITVASPATTDLQIGLNSFGHAPVGLAVGPTAPGVPARPTEAETSRVEPPHDRR